MLVDPGRLYMLKVITGQQSPETIRMGLYTNTVAWTRATVLTDLTEVAASGYARQNTAGWQPPTLDGAGNGDTTAAQVTFANTSGAAVVVKGFFYVTVTTGVFLGGDAFAADYTIPPTVGTLGIFPELRDNNLP